MICKRCKVDHFWSNGVCRFCHGYMWKHMLPDWDCCSEESDDDGIIGGILPVVVFGDPNCESVMDVDNSDVGLEARGVVQGGSRVDVRNGEMVPVLGVSDVISQGEVLLANVNDRLDTQGRGLQAVVMDVAEIKNMIGQLAGGLHEFCIEMRNSVQMTQICCQAVQNNVNLINVKLTSHREGVVDIITEEQVDVSVCDEISVGAPGSIPNVGVSGDVSVPSGPSLMMDAPNLMTSNVSDANFGVELVVNNNDSCPVKEPIPEGSCETVFDGDSSRPVVEDNLEDYSNNNGDSTRLCDKVDDAADREVLAINAHVPVDPSVESSTDSSQYVNVSAFNRVGVYTNVGDVPVVASRRDPHTKYRIGRKRRVTFTRKRRVHAAVVTKNQLDVCMAEAKSLGVTAEINLVNTRKRKSLNIAVSESAIVPDSTDFDFTEYENDTVISNKRVNVSNSNLDHGATGDINVVSNIVIGNPGVIIGTNGHDGLPLLDEVDFVESDFDLVLVREADSEVAGLRDDCNAVSGDVFDGLYDRDDSQYEAVWKDDKFYLSRSPKDSTHVPRLSCDIRQLRTNFVASYTESRLNVQDLSDGSVRIRFTEDIFTQGIKLCYILFTVQPGCRSTCKLRLWTYLNNKRNIYVFKIPGSLFHSNYYTFQFSEGYASKVIPPLTSAGDVANTVVLAEKVYLSGNSPDFCFYFKKPPSMLISQISIGYNIGENPLVCQKVPVCVRNANSNLVSDSSSSDLLRTGFIFGDSGLTTSSETTQVTVEANQVLDQLEDRGALNEVDDLL